VSRPACDPSGWLRTGDAGRRDADGFVSLFGRVDGVINRGGEKVYPREVEEVLRLHAAVAEAAVVAEADPVLGERPVAFVVLRSADAAPGLESELLALCRRELSRHKQPARIEVMPSLPATPTGKVRHGELRALAGQRSPVAVSS
jgi:acyl-coenzyme A synthetase/AMP-(fatty) acid ligase